MGHFVLTDADVLVDGARLTCRTNQITLNASVAVQDDTSFCSSWESKLGGRRSSTLAVSGFADFTDTSTPSLAVDPALNGGNGTLRVVSASHVTPAVGGVAWTTRALQFDYTPIDGAHGDVAPFSVNFAGSAPLVRGLWSDVGAVETASWDSDGVNVGAVSSSQRLWVGIHVVALDGTSITPVVETDTDDTWSSAVTAVSGTAITGTGGVWLSAVGPITDTWARVGWTAVSLTSAQVYTVIGVGPL